ncbi:MAG TPA: YCF48-related protein [Thermoanaerobaculia bacterium]
MRNRAGWMKVFGFVVLIGVLYAPSGSAGVNTWSTGGPNVLSAWGGSLAIVRSDPSVLYLAAASSGFFKSTDEGATWTSLPSPAPSVFAASIVPSPSSATTAYALVDGQIYRTGDGGGSWSAKRIPIDSTSVASVDSLSIDPSAPSILFAGAGDGVYKSTDEGLTWTRGSGINGDVEVILSHPARPSTLFAVLRSTVLSKSEDGGVTWKLTPGIVAAGHFGPIISSIIGDPNDADIVYVTTDQGLFRTLDGGATWTLLSQNLDVSGSSVLAIDPSRSASLYFSRSGSGLYRSTDAGASWTLSRSGLPQSSISSLAVDPQHPATVFASTPDGVFASADSALTWTRSSAGIRGALIQTVAIDPTQSSVAFAGTDHGLFRTRNGGRSWDVSGLTGHSVYGIAMSASEPSTLFASTDSFVFKSVDAGETWLAANAGFASSLFFGGDSVVSLAMDPNTPTTLYASTPDGLYKSTDNGGSWLKTKLRDEIFALTIDPSSPSVIYAGTEADYSYGGIFGTFDLLMKSTDGGVSWNKSQKGLPEGSATITAIAIDPSNASVLYAGTDAGLYKSLDAGTNWVLIAPELAQPVSSLVIDPVKTSTLYAGTSQGVFRSKDGGATWQPFSQGLSSNSVRTLAIDSAGRHFYAGTGNGGVFAFEFPSGPVDLTVANNGLARLLSIDANDERLTLDNVDSAGTVSREGPYGPYDGWTASRLAAGSDGLTRILWNNEDGSAALWLYGPKGNQASYHLEPLAGQRALDVTSLSAAGSRILWSGDGGRVTFTTIDKTGNVYTTPPFGPYRDWQAVAAADGADGFTRVLWNKVDGSTALSFFGAEGLVISYRFAPASGWMAVDLTVGADGQVRILWTHDDGRLALWRVDNSGNPTAGPVYAPPDGLTATHLAAGVDGSIRVLLTDPNGATQIWLMSADNVFQRSFVFGPQ